MTGCIGSAQELESAFTNLLVNGMKYTLSEGTVRMRWWTDEDGAYFSVIDSGIGIPAEHIPQINRAVLSGGRGTFTRTRRIGTRAWQS